MIEILLAILCTEALTELVVHSQIFEPLRLIIQQWGKWPAKLVTCGYCFSVWAGFFWTGLLVPLSFPSSSVFVNLFALTLVVHRCANFLNDFADRFLRESPFADADAMFKGPNE